MALPPVPTLFRIINLIVAAGIIVVGVIKILDKDNRRANDGVLAMYFIFFATLIVSGEFRFSFTKDLFGFLRAPIGKGLFIVFCGTLFLSKRSVIISIIGGIIIVIGLLNIVFYAKLQKPEEDTKAKQREVIRGNSKAQLPSVASPPEETNNINNNNSPIRFAPLRGVTQSNPAPEPGQAAPATKPTIYY